MEKSYNDNIVPLLELIEKLCPYVKGTKIKFPKIISIGMQSDNKAEGLNHQQAEEEQQKVEEAELTAEEKRLEEEQLSILS